jgi:type II restriction enzyme
MSEEWVTSFMFCPNCTHPRLSTFPNNSPVADFFCINCKEEFELKSKSGLLGNKIVDGAYESMITRLSSSNNPNFFFLSYAKKNFLVENLILIPKHFFLPGIIERRKPLSKESKRAGWVGCNINLSHVPDLGKIYIVKQSKIIDQNEVKEKWNHSLFLRKASSESRGWLIDVLNAVDKIDNREFTLKDMYNFERELSLKYPENSHIKEKIRQQLQVLRDKGIIEFLGDGKYKKVLSSMRN